MANLQTAINKFLTLALLSAVFMIQIAFVFGDLAPKEDEDDDVKPPTDLKKIDEIVTTLQPPKTSLGFIHAFIASFSVIMVSEIGDKTFFIAAIMSMVSKLQTFEFTDFIVINLLFILLEIPTSNCFRWCNLRACLDDCPVSCFWNGFH